MDQSTRPSSLDVPTQAIDALHDETRELLNDLYKILSQGKEIDKDSVEQIVNRFFLRLPTALQREIEDKKENFKKALSDTMWSFIRAHQGEGRQVRDEDMTNLVAELMAVCTQYHAFSLVRNPYLDEKQLAPDFEPGVKNKYISVAVQKLSAIGIWLVSAYTSWMGLTHYLGKLIGKAEEMFAYHMPADLTLMLRHLLAIGASVGISQLIQLFKEEIEKKAHEGKPGHRAAGEVVSKFRKDRGNAVFALCALLAIFDVATNVNGIATATMQRHEVSDQLADARKNIGERVAGIETHIGEVRKIPDRVGDEVEQSIQSEAAGTSETGVQGEGPVYHTKKFLYQEVPSSGAELERTELGKSLKKKTEDSGLIQGEPLKAEVEKRTEEGLKRVSVLVDDVKKLTNALTSNPDREIEYLQKDLDAIVEKLHAAASILNDDIPEDLKSHLAKYDKVLEKLVSLARASGKYPNLQADKMKRWKLPPIEVDTSRIKLKRFHYIGFEDLWPTMKQQLSPRALGLFIILILIGGYLSSYGDLLTIPLTRRGYKRDSEESAGKKEEFIDRLKNKIVNVLVMVLNAGPFSQYLKPGINIDPETVGRVLDERIQELTVLPEDLGWRKVARKILPLVRKSEAKGQTEVAERHNIAVEALKRIASHPEEIMILLQKFLPGLPPLLGQQAGTELGIVRTANVEAVTKENILLQKKRLEDASDRAYFIATSLETNVLTDELLRGHRQDLDVLRRDLEKHGEALYPQNNEFYGKAAVAFNETNVLFQRKVEELKDQVQFEEITAVTRQAERIRDDKRNIHYEEIAEQHNTLNELEGQLNDLEPNLRTANRGAFQAARLIILEVQQQCDIRSVKAIQRAVTQAPINDASSDAEMNFWQSQCAAYRQALAVLRSVGADHTRDIAGTLRDISALEKKIADITQEKQRRAASAAQAEELKIIVERDQTNFGRLEMWYTEIERQGTNREIALCTLLGYPHIVGVVRRRSNQRFNDTEYANLFRNYEGLLASVNRMIDVVSINEAQEKYRREIIRDRFVSVMAALQQKYYPDSTI